jgi:hypothetical protein
MRLRLFGGASLVAFGMSTWVARTGEVLRIPTSRAGIVSFELAGTPEAAQRITAAWGTAGVEAALFNIRIDFLYLVAYGVALSLGCAVARVWWQRRSAPLAQLGALLTYAMLIAACSDACENTLMLRAISEPTKALWPQLARVFALVKFALLAVGLLYILGGMFGRIGQRRTVRAA